MYPDQKEITRLLPSRDISKQCSVTEFNSLLNLNEKFRNYREETLKGHFFLSYTQKEDHTFISFLTGSCPTCFSITSSDRSFMTCPGNAFQRCTNLSGRRFFLSSDLISLVLIRNPCNHNTLFSCSISLSNWTQNRTLELQLTPY